MKIQPIILHGKIIRLEPLTEKHVPHLALVGKDSRIWRYLPYGELTSEADMRSHVGWLLNRAALGIDLPFAVIYQDTDRAIGCTRYLDIAPEHKKLEIGGTWYGKDYHHTKVNTECKFLLLKHAFEVLGCIRVQFKTDARNTGSQAALERIMARKEGILRNHMILPDGYVRDSVFYSIIASEWSAVKAILEEKLARSYEPNKST